MVLLGAGVGGLLGGWLVVLGFRVISSGVFLGVSGVKLEDDTKNTAGGFTGGTLLL